MGVQSPTEINAPRGCAVILRRICQLSLTRITHQVSRAFDLNATSRYYGAAGNKKKQKELDKIIKAYDDYIDDKMMNDWLEGDGDADYDFL